MEVIFVKNNALANEFEGDSQGTKQTLNTEDDAELKQNTFELMGQTSIHGRSSHSDSGLVFLAWACPAFYKPLAFIRRIP